MKRHYRVVLTSDEERTEVECWLTKPALDLLLDIAKQVNGKATWSADIRMDVAVVVDSASDAA